MRRGCAAVHQRASARSASLNKPAAGATRGASAPTACRCRPVGAVYRARGEGEPMPMLFQLGRVGNLRLTRPEEGPNGCDREGCTQVALAPCCRSFEKSVRKQAIPLHELVSETSDGRVAPGRGRALRSRRPALRWLRTDAPYAHHRPISQTSLLFDRAHAIVEELANDTQTLEAPDGKRSELELLGLGPPLVEPRPTSRWRATAATPRPVQPAEGARLSVPHQRKRTQPRPLGAVPDQAFLDTMCKYVADLIKQGRVVEQRLRGVPPLPERPPPLHQRTHLLRDVGQEVLHELREISARRPNDQVQVIRREVEGEDLDAVETNSSGEYAPEDVVRLPGRTQEEPPLKTTNGGEENRRGIKHAERSAHRERPPTQTTEH